MKFIRPLLDLVSDDGKPDFVVGSQSADIGKVIFFLVLLLIAFAIFFVIWLIQKNVSEDEEQKETQEKEEKEDTSFDKPSTSSPQNDQESE